MAGLSGSLSYAPSWMPEDPHAEAWQPEVAQQVAPVYTDGSQVARGFRSALTGAKSAVQSYGGQLAELVGAEQAAQEMNQAAIENATLARQQAPRVRTVRQVMEGGNYVDDGLDYAAGVVGQAVPYLALGVAGGAVGRGAGLASGMRAGLGGEALAARAAAGGTAGAAAAFHPVMAGDVAAQLRDDPAAAHMGVGERALRANAVGGMQAAANALAPAHMVNRAFVRAPIASGAMGVAQSAGRIGMGAAETAGMSGLGEMAEDVIGQTHQMQYNPNYRFNAEQTAEAGAAGFIGAGPTSIGHAAGVEMLDTANAGARQAGDNALGQAYKITEGARQLAGDAYDALPPQAQDALKAVVATGQLTADAAAALAPHVDKLGGGLADAVKGFYENTKNDVEDYTAMADAGVPPLAEDVATDVAVNATSVARQAGKEAVEFAKGVVNDPAVADIAGPVKKYLEGAKNKLDGLSRVAAIMTDPSKWLNEDEKMTPGKLGNIRAMMNRPAEQERYAEAVLNFLDSTPMEGQSAAEVRSLAQRLKAGESLTDKEAVRMYSQFRLAAKAHQTAEDMAHVLKFDERLKAGQEKQKTPIPAKFSRQKTKSVEAQWAKELADQRSESFRNRIGEHVREMFGSSEVGRELMSREDGGQREVDGVISFMSNVADGKSGYDTKAAINMAMYLSSKFGDAGKAAIDNIIKTGDLEFGMDSEKSERIAGMRDSISGMYSDAGVIRDKLLKDKEANLKDLVADVEGVQDVDANRESYEKAILALRKRAAKTADPEARFQLMEQAADAEDALRADGLDGLKAKWVGDGVVDAKKFNALVEAVSKYSKSGERLARPERQKAGHATEANYAAEDLDDPDANRAAAEEADNDARPGKDKSEAEEVADARNAERGVQGENDRAAPIWFGTNAFDAGGHKADKIGAPLTRHPSGDHAKGDIPDNQYNDAIEAAHAKYGHRVTRAHGVRPLAWAEEMARTEGKKSDYAYLDDAMQALLKEDQARLKNEKLTEEDRKWIGNRAALAERLLAEQARKGGIEKFPAAGHFFDNRMNQNYRYYRMEQHDASNLSYSAEQLQAAYAVKEDETTKAYAKRTRARDGDVFDEKVYTDSLLPLITAKGKTIKADVAKLVTNAMKHHQAGDITGAGDKTRGANFAQEILTAFHTVVAALMTSDGMHPSDPLGAKRGTGAMLTTDDPIPARHGSAKKGEDNLHFDPSLVVFRDPTGRVLQELGEHVKVNSVRNFFTLGDLMDIQGVDVETGRTLRGEQDARRLLLKVDGKDAPQSPMAPGVFTQGDLDSVVKKATQTSRNEEGRRDAKSREAGNERGTAYRGLTFDGVQKTIDVHALLARVIERNGMDAFEAMKKGDIPKETAGHFLYEALEELKAMGFDGPLMDMAQTRFDNLVLFSREITGDDGSPQKVHTTFGAVKKYITTDRYKAENGEPVLFHRDLQDAKMHEALTLLRAAERTEDESKARVKAGEARDNDNTPLGDKARADAVTKGLGNTEFAKGQPERYSEANALSGFDKRLDENGNVIEVPTEGGARAHVLGADGKLTEVPSRVKPGTKVGVEGRTKPLEYSSSEIDNFRLKGLLKDFAEMSNGDAPLFDRSVEAIFSDTADMMADIAPRTTGPAATLRDRLNLIKEILEGVALNLRLSPEKRARLNKSQREAETKLKAIADAAEAAKTEPAGVSQTKGMQAYSDYLAERKTELASRKIVNDMHGPRINQRFPQAAMDGKAMPAAPLNKPVEPYAQPRVPAEVKREAKIESKVTATNKPNLLAAAKAAKDEAVAKAKKDLAAQLAGERVEAAEAKRLAEAPPEEAPVEPAPVKEPVKEAFDPRKKAKEFARTEPKTGRETVELAKTLTDEQLRDFALALPRLRMNDTSMVKQAYNVLGADADFGSKPMAAWAKQQRDRAGIRFNRETGIFEEVAPDSNPGTPAFSRQSTTGTKGMFTEETKTALKAELNRLVKDAFGFETPETLGEDISGSYLDKLIKVSQTASDPLGALHHEVWHGIEQLLGDMGPHGKKVLADIYAHTSSKEMQAWLKTQYLDDGGVASQLTDKSERAAFAFQKFMAGEKMPLSATTKTRWEKIKAFIAKVAAKLGIETTTTGERATNFFDYVKDGSFARDMENAPAVRRGLGEKNGDDLMNSAAKHLKPFVEAFEVVFQHSAERVRKLDVPEYNEILQLYAGASGKGGYRNEYNRNVNKWSAKVDALTDGMDDAAKLAFLSSPQYRGFRGQLEGYMKKAGVDDKDILGLYSKLVSFNSEKVADRMEEFITDLQMHGGLKNKGAEARKIANQIADRGFFYDKDIELFKGNDAIKDKWLEREPAVRISRYIERAVYLTEQTRAFSDGKTMRGKLDTLIEAGSANAGPSGRKLIEDYTKAMEGRLGEGALSPMMKKLMGTMLFANNVTILPMAVFSQMLDPMNMALRKNSMHGSIDALWRGVSEMPKSFDKFRGNYSKDYWETLANQVGSAPTRIITNVMANLMNGMEINGTIGKLNETFFKYNFMDQWNRSMHVEATKHAVEFLREHAENTAKKMGGEDKDGTLRSKRFLDELGLEHTDVKFNADGELILNDKVESAIVQYVEEAMAHPDAGSNPMWMNDPRFAMISQMKRFTFAHAKYVLGRGMSELSKGNAFPIAPMAIAMPWMMAADGLRNTLTGSEGYQATSALDEAKHLAERAGHFGRGQFGLDIDEAIVRGDSPVEALLGPSVERFGNIARGLHNGNAIDAMTE